MVRRVHRRQRRRLRRRALALALALALARARALASALPRHHCGRGSAGAEQRAVAIDDGGGAAAGARVAVEGEDGRLVCAEASGDVAVALLSVLLAAGLDAPLVGGLVGIGGIEVAL